MNPKVDGPKHFWSRVEKGGPAECWPWTGGQVGKMRYGAAKVGGIQSRLAHRIAWQLTNGPIPEGMYVCHRCDNAPCCNPAHLFLGTQSDNMLDMVAKGRRQDSRGDKNWLHRHPEQAARGEAVGAARLTDAKVRVIRARYAAGDLQQEQLAREYGVHEKTIARIARGRGWRHVI